MPSSTTGFFGRRWSTGGSLPCCTRSASIGASLNLVGAAAGGAVAPGGGAAGGAAAAAAVGAAAPAAVGAAGDVGTVIGPAACPPHAANPAPAVTTADKRRNSRRVIGR